MVQSQDISLAELHTIATNTAKRLCMTKDMKEGLDELYYKFQSNLHKLAIKNCVGPHFYQAHVREATQTRGGTGKTWKNFLKYDPQPKKLFAEFKKHEGRNKVSELWFSKDKLAKILYRNIDYLIGLHLSNADTINISQASGHASTSVSWFPQVNSCALASKVSQQKTLSLVTSWSLKMEDDLKASLC
ncbi:hypothetical protein PCANC_21215 [Puccinia coronata f. sp. avenae]|uniref:Uncharacterized protein n=1 Tax=Puccinia coronata f. sp. avenae TaxID=200324 RepID=A0A2N5V8A1_9BASI|nr:hypothetical protein PCANC_21215 [Puccinia coronata f. sp. avenae]PLW46225.1 hypothetical protein PCASD_03728 [Puccinia coronata f. sp. avenae]